MLNSLVLETAIGLVFVYLIFSLIASAIAEYISSALDRRGEHLKHILFNLFDNDDPKGRTILNLFVAHPMIQALSATVWKPTFQSAQDRRDEVKSKLDRSSAEWQAAARTVADAEAALAAAGKAEAAAAGATAAAANLKAALKGYDPQIAATAEALETAVATAAAAASAAQSEAAAADLTSRSAQASGQDMKIARAVPTSSPTPPVAVSAPSPAPPSPPIAPPPVDLQARARAALDAATAAATNATRAAKQARQAAAAADKAKKGLGGDLLGRVSIPKYITDRTFVAVLVHVLAADETLRSLADSQAAPPDDGGPSSRASTSLWERFVSALKIVGGVASRLPDGAAKAGVSQCIASIEESLKLVNEGSIQAVAAVGKLERGINDLRAAIAAVPDDTLRAALDREVGTSLLPLHALGQDILTLQRAGQAVALMAEGSIKTALTSFLAEAGEDLDAFQRNLASWYNDVMDHATGWYKRNTQLILLGIAVVLCAANNVDTVSMVRHLTTDPKLRSSALDAARAFDQSESAATGGAGATAATEGANPPVKTLGSPQERDQQYRSALEKSALPLWWTKSEWCSLWYKSAEAKASQPADKAPAAPGKSFWANFSPRWLTLLEKGMGLVISIMAVSMGAPFWFDALNKLVNVRLVGKRPDPSVAPAPVPVPASAPSPSRPAPVPRTTS